MAKEGHAVARDPLPERARLSRLLETAKSSGSDLALLDGGVHRALVGRPAELERMDGVMCAVCVEKIVWLGLRSGEMALVQPEKNKTDSDSTLLVAAHTGPVTRLLYIERLALVWSLSEDGTIQAWKIPTNNRAKPKKVYAVKGYSGVVTAVVDAASYVVVGYESGAVVAWDAGRTEAVLASSHTELSLPVCSLCTTQNMFEVIVFVGTVGKIHTFKVSDIIRGSSWPWFKMLNCDDGQKALPVVSIAEVDEEFWAACGRYVLIDGWINSRGEER